jgi:hypothetical protein
MQVGEHADGRRWQRNNNSYYIKPTFRKYWSVKQFSPLFIGIYRHNLHSINFLNVLNYVFFRYKRTEYVPVPSLFDETESTHGLAELFALGS